MTHCRSPQSQRLLPLFKMRILLILLAHSIMGGSAKCQCSPFSGNQASCCSGADKQFCGSAFQKHACTAEKPVCCTSDFGGACCSQGSTCSPGCRDSIHGGCRCIEQPSLAASGFDLANATHVLGFSAAAECPATDIQAWNCTACKGQGSGLSNINVTTAQGHLAYVGWDEAKGRIQVRRRFPYLYHIWTCNPRFCSLRSSSGVRPRFPIGSRTSTTLKHPPIRTLAAPAARRC